MTEYEKKKNSIVFIAKQNEKEACKLLYLYYKELFFFEWLSNKKTDISEKSRYLCLKETQKAALQYREDFIKLTSCSTSTEDTLKPVNSEALKKTYH